MSEDIKLMDFFKVVRRGVDRSIDVFLQLQMDGPTPGNWKIVAWKKDGWFAEIVYDLTEERAKIMASMINRRFDFMELIGG